MEMYDSSRERSSIEEVACDESSNAFASGRIPDTSEKLIDSKSGICQSEPAVARTTFGEYISTLPGDVMTASTPIASAVRSMVPALPGS